MKASDFTRYDCQVGNRRLTYATLQRDYCCNKCGGLLTEKCTEKAGWFITCGVCGAQDFIHQHEYARQQQEAREVLADLPAELAEMLFGQAPQETKRVGIVRLQEEPVEI